MTMRNVPFTARDTVRVGFIGVGSRGNFLMNTLVPIEGVIIAGIYDPDHTLAEKAAQQVVDQDRAEPRILSGQEDWKRLLEMDLDIVYITCPWELHAFYAIQAMEAGKHVAIEVPAAVTMEECWQLVHTSERTRRHCIMLENCCYGYWEMMVRNMAHAGVFGTLTHAECAYIHDLRKMMVQEKDFLFWRLQHHVTRNGNLYPTHGLGPVAQSLGIGTSDEFDYLVSISSREAALSEYAAEQLPEKNIHRNTAFLCGDMNISIIRTKLGRTIMLQHDVVTPRPYDRIFLVAGTRGLFRDYPPRLYLDGEGPHDEWLPLESYQSQWEDALWKQEGENARASGGHGGMDYLMNLRLIEALRQGTVPDMDVYDAALWSAPSALSEQSVKSGSQPIPFPDFLRK